MKKSDGSNPAASRVEGRKGSNSKKKRSMIAKQKLTEQQEAQRRRYKAMKWAEYDAKQQALRETSDTEQRYSVVIRAIHDYAEHDAWFAVNTPYPFAKSHRSKIPLLAALSCRYLRRLARAGNEDSISTLTSLALDLTESLDDLLEEESKASDEIANRLESLAQGLPYWPVLYSRHAAANNHLPRLIDRIRLGEKCYLNVSEKANYSLRTPINRFVWKCIRHFQEMHEIIDYHERDKEGTINERLEPYVFREVSPSDPNGWFRGGMIYRDEIPIYLQSYRLPKLTKDRVIAEQWADVAIMPYVKIRFPDLRKVPELKGIKSGVEGRSYAHLRKAVIQALRQVARKA